LWFLFLHNIIKRTKSRIIRWTRHVTCIEDRTNENIIFFGEIVRNTPPLKNVGADRKYMMITVTANSMAGRFVLDFSCSGASGGLF
jgi:hypothetical protein